MSMQASFFSLALCGTLLSGCASDRYDQSASRALTGAAVGAAVGAAAGAATGVNPLAGAAAGATAGAVLGTAVKPSTSEARQYYRDSRGYCYYLNRKGQPVYDYDARC